MKKVIYLLTLILAVSIISFTACEKEDPVSEVSADVNDQYIKGEADGLKQIPTDGKHFGEFINVAGRSIPKGQGIDIRNYPEVAEYLGIDVSKGKSTSRASTGSDILLIKVFDECDSPPCIENGMILAGKKNGSWIQADNSGQSNPYRNLSYTYNPKGYTSGTQFCNSFPWDTYRWVLECNNSEVRVEAHFYNYIFPTLTYYDRDDRSSHMTQGTAVYFYTLDDSYSVQWHECAIDDFL